MALDHSLPAAAATAAHRMDPDLLQAAIDQYRATAAELRRNASWGAIANGALLGRFSSFVQFAQGCTDLDRCNETIAAWLEGEADKLQGHLDQTQLDAAEHGTRFDSAAQVTTSA